MTRQYKNRKEKFEMKTKNIGNKNLTFEII